MSKKPLQKILFVPDTHAPYHDVHAFELMLNAAKCFKPDHVIVMGDFVDCYSVSSHSKDPYRKESLYEELETAKNLLRLLKKLKAKNNVFVSGNHEDRLSRFIADRAPELKDFVSVQRALELKDLGFKYVPYKESFKLGKMYITHDCGNAGRYAHLKALDTFQHNIIIGHTHRIGYAVEGNAAGESHITAMFGWLGDDNTVDYMHKVKIKRDWSKGFGIGYLDPETQFVYVVPVPIVNYTCVVEGKLYKV